MQFTLGMPFLGVLGKFYRNRKDIAPFVLVGSFQRKGQIGMQSILNDSFANSKIIVNSN